MREAPNIPQQPNPVRKGGRVTDRITPADIRAMRKGEAFIPRVFGPWLERLTAPGSKLMSLVDPDDIRIRLLRAGFPMGLRANTFVLVKFFGIILGVLLFMAYFPILNNILSAYYSFTIPLWFFPFWVAFGGFYGFKMPDIWLGMQVRRRQTIIQLILPDMIDLISISVEAGLGLISAIQRISERFENPLSEEFLRTLQEVRLGRAQTDALRDMARRVDVPDLTTLLTSVVQAELLGLAVANVLRVQSERLRERRSQRAREAAQKAPIKMTFPLVLFIFPALFIVILGPAMIKIFLGQATF
jgi:tight adherence protein C